MLLAAFVVLRLRDDDEQAHDESWTVLYYAMADTNLEPDMLGDVREIGDVGSQKDLNIVALVDRSAEYSDESVLGMDDWVGGKVLRVDHKKAEVLEDLGTTNTGDPAVLADFVTQGMQDYPADHYALIFSDHGASWPGLGPDDSAQDVLTVAELRQGIGDGMAAAQVDKLDLLGFDACLMATYEVADTVAPLAHRMVASEELEPGHGWDYGALGVLADDSSASVDTLGRAIVDGFKSQAKDEDTDAEITLSLVNLDKMDALSGAVDRFSQALSAHVGDIAPKVGRDRAKTLSFARMPDPTMNPHMADLGDLARDIGKNAPAVTAESEAVVTGLDDVVVRNIDGEATAGATGLSIYFPPYAEFYDQRYVGMYGPTAWSGFLDSYYATGQAVSVPPRFVNADGAPQIETDADEVAVTGTLDPNSEKNFAEAFLTIGVVEEDGTITNIVAGKAGQSRDEDTDDVTGTFDYTALTITDGTNTTYAYLQASTEHGVTTISIPLAYYAPGAAGTDQYEDVQLQLIVDPDSGDILEEAYYLYDETAETFGEFNADPEGTIVPQLPNIADGTETWLPADEAGLRANLPDLVYDFERLEPGTVLDIQIVVKDFAGNSATVSGQVPVPDPDN